MSEIEQVLSKCFNGKAPAAKHEIPPPMLLIDSSRIHLSTKRGKLPKKIWVEWLLRSLLRRGLLGLTPPLFCFALSMKQLKPALVVSGF